MKKTAKTVFLLYCLLMLWLLFGQRMNGGYGQGTYLERLRMNTNLLPFETITLFWRIITGSSDALLVRHAVVNLVGNIVMFIPLGFLLPAVWDKFQSFRRMILCVIVLIAAVELTQLLTLLGSCDTDDLILNVLGAMIGFCFYKSL